jgi:hypothetical protein
MALPVGVAWSLLGYLAARVYLQQQQQQQEKEENGRKAGWLVLSPLLAGAVAANVGVAWHGRIMGWSYLVALSRYYAGDVSCLGSNTGCLPEPLFYERGGFLAGGST